MAISEQEKHFEWVKAELTKQFDLLRRQQISRIIGEKLVLDLVPKKGVLFHGAGLMLGKTMMVFLARSGGGKSTLLSYCKKGRCIHDDKMAVFRADECWYASGVPMLDNKGNWGRPEYAPLKAFYLIEKTKKHYLVRLPAIEAFPKVAQFAIEPTGRKDLRKMLSETLMDLVTEVPVYRLGYVLGDDVSKII